MKNKLFLAVLLFAGTTAFAQFSQKPLPYSYSALEPNIDAQTMEIHYSKHHAAYVKNLNDALKGKEGANDKIETILANISKYDSAVRNNAGGHYNHELFWSILTPNRNNASTELVQAINTTFKSLDGLKTKLNEAATKRFGSGWAWLSVNEAGELVVSSTANQDNPLMDIASKKGTPILGIDVWEHAYYLKYQNKRGDYLAAIWNVINWEEVSRRYAEAKAKK